MKISFRSIISAFFVLGFYVSFFNRDQFGFSYLQDLSQSVYKVAYFILVSVVLYGFLILFKLRFHTKFAFLSRILFFISLSWLYGSSIGFVNGNSLIHILSNYLFLLLALLPLLAFRDPVRDVTSLIIFTFSLTFYASFAYIVYSFRELPGFLSVAKNIFLLDFNRNAYGYSYVANSPFYIFAAVISLLYILHRSSFNRLILPTVINLRRSSRLLYFPWYILSKFSRISFLWFIWLGFFTYTSNAYLLWAFVVFTLYLSSVYRILIPFLVLGFSLAFYSVVAVISERFGFSRFEQFNDVLSLIHFWGNGLGSYVAGRGTPYGTELLSLGLFAQLGVFAVPFFALLLYYLYNSCLLIVRGRSALFLLSASFSPYVFSIFSNPSISAPWAFLLVIVGAYTSRIAVLLDSKASENYVLS